MEGKKKQQKKTWNKLFCWYVFAVRYEEVYQRDIWLGVVIFS